MVDTKMGSIFLGGIFLIVAIYLFIAAGSLEGQLFGGGILLLLALILLVPALTGIGSKKE